VESEAKLLSRWFSDCGASRLEEGAVEKLPESILEKPTCFISGSIVFIFPLLGAAGAEDSGCNYSLKVLFSFFENRSCLRSLNRALAAWKVNI